MGYGARYNAGSIHNLSIFGVFETLKRAHTSGTAITSCPLEIAKAVFKPGQTLVNHPDVRSSATLQLLGIGFEVALLFGE